MTTQNQALSQFIIFRDGQPDPEYIDQLIAQERAVALNEAARTALDATKLHITNLAKTIGTGLLRAVDN